MSEAAWGIGATGVLVGFLCMFFVSRLNTHTVKQFVAVLTALFGGTAVTFIVGNMELGDVAPEDIWKYPFGLVVGVIASEVVDRIRGSRGALSGRGGEGGSGTIVGDRGKVVAGKGGRGGVAGRGGRGGSGTVLGDDGLVIAGDGGDASGADGRGGRRTPGPTERYGFDTSMWGYGSGGRGPDAPEFTRRLEVLTQIRQEYLDRFEGDGVYILAGVDVVPVAWVNQRLDELGEGWHVGSDDLGRYVLPPLPN